MKYLVLLGVSLSSIACGDVALRCSEVRCDVGQQYCIFTPNDSGRDSHLYDASCRPLPEQCREAPSCNCLKDENVISEQEGCSVDERGQVNVDGVAG